MLQWRTPTMRSERALNEGAAVMCIYMSGYADGHVDAACGACLMSEIGFCVSRRVLDGVGGSQWPG